jgi:hypothetical protein
VQVVGYDTREEPALLLATAGAVSRQPLSRGTELAYALGERRCAGTIENGSHRACERPEAPYCPLHTTPWSVASNRDSEDPHAIYLAAFAPRTFKVGVTRLWRLDARLEEQGADRAAHVRTAPDGRVAREIESEIAAAIDGGERVRVATKIRGLHRTVEEGRWNDLLDDFDPIATFQFEYDLGLGSRPVVATIAAGTVIGTKGRILALDRAGTAYAVDLRDLLGYELLEGTDGRALQASLDAFE